MYNIFIDKIDEIYLILLNLTLRYCNRHLQWNRIETINEFIFADLPNLSVL